MIVTLTFKSGGLVICFTYPRSLPIIDIKCNVFTSFNTRDRVLLGYK